VPPEQIALVKPDREVRHGERPSDHYCRPSTSPSQLDNAPRLVPSGLDVSLNWQGQSPCVAYLWEFDGLRVVDPDGGAGGVASELDDVGDLVGVPQAVVILGVGCVPAGGRVGDDGW
jgi:hypothetical protein